MLFCSRNGLSLVIVEGATSLALNNLCRVVKEDTGAQIGEQVPESVFGGVVYPLGDPNRLVALHQLLLRFHIRLNMLEGHLWKNLLGLNALTQYVQRPWVVRISGSGSLQFDDLGLTCHVVWILR